MASLVDKADQAAIKEGKHGATPPTDKQHVHRHSVSPPDYAKTHLNCAKAGEGDNAGREIYYDPGALNSFVVRGKTYMKDGKKTNAGPAMGTLLHAVVYKVGHGKHREDHIVSHGKAAALLREMQHQLSGHPLIFVVNYQVPGDPPLSMVHFYAVPQQAPNSPPSPFYRTLNRFCEFDSSTPNTPFATPVPSPMVSPTNNDNDSADASSSSSSCSGDESATTPNSLDSTSPTSDSHSKLAPGEYPLSDYKNRRFKLIPLIVDGPAVVTWAVGAKPVLMGQKVTQRYFRGDNYVEVDVDIGSSIVASQIVGLCRGYARYVTVEMAWVIQGETEEELPEVLIGCVGIDKLDMTCYSDDAYLNTTVVDGKPSSPLAKK